MTFRIRYPSDHVQASVHDTFRHLEICPNPERNETVLSIDIREAGAYTLLCNGQIYAEPCTKRELAPKIHHLLLLRAYQKSHCLAAFHAAAVGQGDRCLLLPGAPGSGKSTLVAALMHMGHDYLTDELVLLLPNEKLRPLPISLGLKRGSWPVIAGIFPSLDSSPTHLQEKGTEVRYLRPVNTPPIEPPQNVRAVLFPRFAAGAGTLLTPITSAVGLNRLAESGYAVPGGLDANVVSELIDWISGTACYDLQIGDLQEAAATASRFLQ